MKNRGLKLGHFLVTLLLVILISSITPFQVSAATKVDYNALADSAFAVKDEGRYQESIDIFLSLLDQLPSDSVQLKSDVLSDLSDSFYRLGDIAQALNYGRRCLEEDEKSGNRENLASSLGNLAAICMAAQQLDQAEEYLKRSISIERELGRPGKLAIRLGMLGELFTQEGRLDEGLKYAQEALDLERTTGREDKLAIRLSQMGNTLINMRRNQEADVCLKEAEQLHRKHHNLPSLAFTLITRGITARALHRNKEAEDCLVECIDLSEQLGLKQARMTAYIEMARLLHSMGDNRDYDYLNRYQLLRDSLVDEQVQQQIADLSVTYETREKEHKIELQEAIIERQQLVYSILAVLVIVLIIALIFIVRSLRLKEQNLKLKDNFMRLISHDLKNPALAQQHSMHALSKCCTMVDSEMVRTQIVQMAEQSDAYVGLLNDLLDWTGMQTGKLKYTPIALDLLSLVQDVVSQLNAQASLKKIDVKVQFEEGDHTVTADRQMVCTIVRNLLSNSIKYTMPEGEISFIVGDHWLQIKDNGIGFDWEEQRRLKVSNKGTKGETGTALGIELALEMAAKNHAKLQFSSAKGVGTIAKLTF